MYKDKLYSIYVFYWSKNALTKLKMTDFMHLINNAFHTGLSTKDEILTTTIGDFQMKE